MASTVKPNSTKPSGFTPENPPKDETKSAGQAETKPKPPRKAANNTKPKAAGRPSKKDKYAKQITEMTQAVGALVLMADAHDGMVIMNGAEDFGNAWADLADKEPKVAAALDRMFTAGAYTQVTVASLAMIVPILMHHNLIPSGFMNPFSAGGDNGDGSGEASTDQLG